MDNNEQQPVIQTNREEVHSQTLLTKEEQVSKYLLPLSIILGSLIIAGSIIYTRPVANIQGIQKEAPNQVSADDINTKDLPFIGNADAKVTIAYWTDYQCPFCKKFEVETLPGIITNYVDKGVVKVVFKDFQFLGPHSTTAAVISHSVWNLYPKQYFTWREAVFNAQDDENAGFGDQASIIALTKTIPGIDATKIQQDVAANSAKYQKLIEADRTEAQGFGIQGTPAIVVGKNMIPGAISFNEIKPLIDAELK